MASYTPKALVPMTRLSNTPATLYTASGVTGVVRTIHLWAPFVTGGSTYSIRLGSGTTNYLFDATPFPTQSGFYQTTFIYNGNWVIAASGVIIAFTTGDGLGQSSIGFFGFEYS